MSIHSSPRINTDYWAAKQVFGELVLLDWIHKLEEDFGEKWENWAVPWAESRREKKTNLAPDRFRLIKGTATRFYSNGSKTTVIDWLKKQDDRISLYLTTRPGVIGSHDQFDLWESSPISLLEDGILVKRPERCVVKFTIDGEPIDPFPFLMKKRQ